MDPKNYEFLVIGAGLPRTGTLSLMHALELILPGNCHHMNKAIIEHETWRDIYNGKIDDEGFKNFFLSNNEVAAVDAPFCFQYERAVRIYPNAKVILTVRDPEGWVKSMKTTIFKRRSLDPTIIFMILGLFPNYLGDPRSTRVQRTWPLGMFREIEKLSGLQKAVLDNNGVDYFNDWVRTVERNVPGERLLKYHVKEGWGPLCQFLNVPLPEEPFPRVNSTDEFDEAHAMIYRRSWLLVYEFISIPIWLYYTYKSVMMV